LGVRNDTWQTRRILLEIFGRRNGELADQAKTEVVVVSAVVVSSATESALASSSSVAVAAAFIFQK